VEMRADAGTSGGRMLAFRIVGWLLGVLTIGLYVPFVVLSFVSDDPAQTIHRFHVVGAFAGLALIGVFSILFVLHPDWTAAWHVLVAQALAYLFGGLMGGDLISGFWISGLIGLVVLGALAPDRRSLVRLPGHPSVALLTYSLLCAIPAWIYAVTNAEFQRVGKPTDAHVSAHHWSGVAVAALAIAGAALATSLRGEGWRVASAATSIAAVAFGVAGLIFADDAGAPPSEAWSWLAVAAGIGFWLLARVEAAREAPSA
jgi:hypothetical protein